MSQLTRPMTAMMLLVGSLTAAPIAAFAAPPMVLAQNPAQGPAGRTSHAPMTAETIEARIASLKADLQITADETDNWNAVAASMRANTAAMEKLAASKRAQSPADMTALDDLMTYQSFAQAHVDGLASLTTAFTQLYNQMPDAQKKVADQVFRTYGRSAPAVKG